MTTKKKYEVFHPDHELAVHFLQNMKNAINSENFLELFVQAGFQDKKPDEWVSMQTLLDIFNELDARGGASLDFVSIGIRLITDAEYPVEFLNLPLIERLTTETYSMFNRGTDIGSVKPELVSPQHIRYSYKTPIPDNFWYGLVYGYCKRMIPNSMRFKVYYDKEKPRRDEGGDETIIHIEWWEKEEK